MKKIIFPVFIVMILFSIHFACTSYAISNPWIECKDDISCASKKAGFNLPLRVKDYSVRAMDDMMEFTFPLDKKRTVTLRKSQSFNIEADENGIKDISGVYNNYPVNKTLNVNGILFNVKGNKRKYYVVNFAAESGYYSFYSKEGMKLKDIKYFYKILEEAEAPRYDYSETNDYSIEQLQDLRRVDGIVEPVYTQDCFPRTLEKMGVTKYCFERANLGKDIFCSASEIKMIKEYYKKGQDKDPLNNGTGQFCAMSDLQ